MSPPEAPDIDNIIKPIFDALCGSEGILIDDCQIQAVDCRWIDWTSYNEKISIYINPLDKDIWYFKKELIFVHFGKGLCYGFNKNPYPEYKGTNVEWSDFFLRHIEFFEKKLIERNKFMENVVNDYYISQLMMPLKPIFHRSRVKDFTVIELDELRKQLNSDLTDPT